MGLISGTFKSTFTLVSVSILRKYSKLELRFIVSGVAKIRYFGAGAAQSQKFTKNNGKVLVFSTISGN